MNGDVVCYGPFISVGRDFPANISGATHVAPWRRSVGCHTSHPSCYVFLVPL
ncbi:hypothetical protein Mapa_001331 [Marchantia paleacea]|nr:hypothetical protein Mapa_001331 [Marchantia paleacea]